MTPLGWALGGALLGAIIGSFLATVILRLPEGRSPLGGRSACDGCGRVLGPLELVPLVSMVWQRGRCRTCGARIDPIHAWTELACAGIGGIAFWLLPPIEALGWSVLCWCLLTLAILDWRHFWLPDLLTLPLACLGLTLAQWVNDVTFADRLLGAAAGYLSLVAISLGYRLLRGRQGLGLGDAKLLGALGAWLGWHSLPFLLLIASLLGLSLVAIGFVRGRRIDATTRLPLGTFLCLAAIPAWLAGRALGL